MINFSVSKQAFYDLTLNYPELPDDLVFITAQQHNEFLNALNSGCVIKYNMTVSNPKPSQFHTWNGDNWIDKRTDVERKAYERSQFKTLSPIEFDIKLNRSGLYDAVQDLIKDNFELRIAYTRAIFFSRTDPFTYKAAALLGLSDEQVDKIWIS